MDVLKSSSGQEALALLQKNDVDLVISDIKMPDFSGVELLREAKQTFAGYHFHHDDGIREHGNRD